MPNLTPAHQHLANMPVDPRIVQEIQGSPSMRAEQGTEFMAGYGGPASYQAMARMPIEQRVVYRAVQDGITNATDISQATGLTPTEVNNGLGGLQKRGLVYVSKEIGTLQTA